MKRKSKDKCKKRKKNNSIKKERKRGSKSDHETNIIKKKRKKEGINLYHRHHLILLNPQMKKSEPFLSFEKLLATILQIKDTENQIKKELLNQELMKLCDKIVIVE